MICGAVPLVVPVRSPPLTVAEAIWLVVQLSKLPLVFHSTAYVPVSGVAGSTSMGSVTADNGANRPSESNEMMAITRQLKFSDEATL